MPEPSVPLLETKLHAPRRRGVVARPRLRDRLDRRDQPALTLVSAAAGFGKTTLVAEWFADGPATAWLSLDRRDNDPARFWTYVVAALRSAAPDAGATARSLLEAPQPSIDAVVATLLNDLHAVAHDVVLVLDDYHVIESAEIHETVAFLLEHLPPHVHLVIASRADPPLPLATLAGPRRAPRDPGRRSALHERRSRRLPQRRDGPHARRRATSHVLEARTEGWIAALQLAALSMQGRDDVAGFIADVRRRRPLHPRLPRRGGARPPEHRCPPFPARDLASSAGSPGRSAMPSRSGPGSRATLEQLERANLFLVPLDDRRTWYRYHHLFADVLRARLLDEDPERVPELHRRASDWYDAERRPGRGDRPRHGRRTTSNEPRSSSSWPPP